MKYFFLKISERVTHINSCTAAPTSELLSQTHCLEPVVFVLICIHICGSGDVYVYEEVVYGIHVCVCTVHVYIYMYNVHVCINYMHS